MKVYSLPPWPWMTLQSIKFQRVVSCALISGNQQTFQRPLHPKNSWFIHKSSSARAELFLIVCFGKHGK